MSDLARLQQLVTDYTIVSSGSWDQQSRDREAVLQRDRRTHQSFAVQITELVIGAGVHRGKAVR